MTYTVGALLVADSFDRADNPAIGSTDGGSLGSLAWQADGGASTTSYSIVSNKCRTHASSPNQPVWVDAGAADVRVQFTIPDLATAGGNIGAVARYINRGGSRLDPPFTVPVGCIWVGVDWYSGQKLYVQYHPNVTDRSRINLTPAVVTCAAGDTITADFFGDQFWLFRNGAPLNGGVPYSSPYNVGATKVGLWQNNNGGTGALDDFKVWQLVPSTTTSWHIGSLRFGSTGPGW